MGISVESHFFNKTIMPRCKVCKTKFESKYFNQKVCENFSCKAEFFKSNPPKKLKTVQKKKSECIQEFFSTAIQELQKKPVCSNCGGRINSNYNPHWNVAHILPKSKYKSVACHPNNWIPLCSSKDNTNKDCHSEFDNNILDRPKMTCFPLALENFEKFKDNVLESGTIFRIFDEI